MLKWLFRRRVAPCTMDQVDEIRRVIFGDEPVKGPATEADAHVFLGHVETTNHISTKRLVISTILMPAHIALLSYGARTYNTEPLLYAIQIGMLGNFLSLITYKMISIHIDLSASAVLVGEIAAERFGMNPARGVTKAMEIIRHRSYFSLRRVEYWLIVFVIICYNGLIATRYIQIYGWNWPL